ncbi:MAG: hypothetical protein ACSHX0_07070 [Akkermansiaceae bacterium]
MKNKLQLLTALGAATIATGSATAGELSGSVSLDYNSHFISYGSDVWGAGDSLTDAPTFNPSVGIDYAISDALTFSTGFWLDVNDNASSDFETVETDIWFGLSYTSGIVTYSATFQNWQYAGDSEEILDLGVSFDVMFAPSITLHHRLDAGPGLGGNEGTYLVVGAGHGFDVNDCFSVSIPVAVGFALDEFHTDEDGYGFASIGLQGSYTLTDATSLNFGVTYYTTDGDVTGNADEDFLTANAGVSFSF